MYCLTGSGCRQMHADRGPAAGTATPRRTPAQWIIGRSGDGLIVAAGNKTSSSRQNVGERAIADLDLQDTAIEIDSGLIRAMPCGPNFKIVVLPKRELGTAA